MFTKLITAVGLGSILALIKWLSSAALVNAGYEARVILGAKNDKTRTIPLRFDADVVDYAGAVTALTAFLTDLANVSAGVVKSYTITGRAIEDAYNRPTDADAEYRDTATVTVEIEDQPLKRGTLFIPMPKIGIFRAAAGSLMDEVDVTDTDLIAYVDNWRTAGQLTLSDGEKAGAVIFGGQRIK